MANPRISLKVEISLGSSIEEACFESLDLANKLGVFVDFDFNGVYCIAVPGARPNDLINAFRKEYDSDHKHKVASAHPIPFQEKNETEIKTP